MAFNCNVLIIIVIYIYIYISHLYVHENPAVLIYDLYNMTNIQ